ncbi:hypothetical protein LMH87_001839 [Akanthomyces muscarius]|uniref:Uncharacterized protein n=1 Tax=Akanthomyces muscarius TaxID=2231603 RepID=A0A9W8UIM5_AKAMU|nr:hypothetical protein LMH87_001839 [Akanthomyces muscarius]KAJ4147307.1 hypothetical protein LMH87_001839 [Akanthomyces muscarius]
MPGRQGARLRGGADFNSTGRGHWVSAGIGLPTVVERVTIQPVPVPAALHSSKRPHDTPTSELTLVSSAKISAAVSTCGSAAISPLQRLRPPPSPT